jgi:hypothetical protein
MVLAEGSEVTLESHLPPNRLHGRQIQGKYAMDLGTEAILDMRQYIWRPSRCPTSWSKRLWRREKRDRLRLNQIKSNLAGGGEGGRHSSFY